MPLDRVSPLAVPVILDVGRERVAGGALDELLAEAEALVREATGEEHPDERSCTIIPFRIGVHLSYELLLSPRPLSWPRMSAAAPLTIAGERLMLDPSGALVWPSRNMLILADLHLEKGSAAAARGRLLPPYDSRSTFDRIALLLRHYSPKIVLTLGDSFHDAAGAARLGGAEAARLAAMGRQARFIWVLGNHDPALPASLPGERVREWSEGPFRFLHASLPGQASMAEISGHYHPKATVPVRGASVTRPCFVTDGHRRLIAAGLRRLYRRPRCHGRRDREPLSTWGAHFSARARAALSFPGQRHAARRGGMKPGLTFLVLLAAAVLEAGGDAVIRRGLHGEGHLARIALILAGGLVLMIYGIVVNLPPWDFGRLLGVYVTLFFLVAQAINLLVFKIAPSTPILAGGALIMAGGLLMTFWRT